MIVEDQRNIKVHFAGLENEDFAQVLHKCSNIKYSLFTVFPFIATQFDIKPLKMKSCTPRSVDYLQGASRHTIMDSGLFTLMFGAHAGERDETFVDAWYEALVQFVLDHDFKGTCVEVDCQKILGVEKAWELRERMAGDLPDNRIVNTFHIEDGMKGLDRMIEFSEYIAISVPEMRVINKKDYVVRLANYIKNKRPELDIHLLGCTEQKLLKECNFCTSADSTSWQSVNRYGTLTFNDGKKAHRLSTRSLKYEAVLAKFKDELDNIFEYFEIEPNEKRYSYYSNYALAGQLLKEQYTIQAGDQN